MEIFGVNDAPRRWRRKTGYSIVTVFGRSSTGCDRGGMELGCRNFLEFGLTSPSCAKNPNFSAAITKPLMIMISKEEFRN
jgi:hypothetical protein